MAHSLDTNEIISQADIRESFTEVPDSVKSGLDSMTLTFIRFACDCPDFVIESSRDSNGQYLQSFYLEPAREKNALPDMLLYTGNKFTLFGRVINESGFPANARSQDPEPTPGRVFKYWCYKVRRPYRFWGPTYKVADEPDSTERTAVIVVR